MEKTSNEDGKPSNIDILTLFKYNLFMAMTVAKKNIKEMAKLKKIVRRIRRKVNSNIQLTKLMLVGYKGKSLQNIFVDLKNVEDWENLEKNIDNTRDLYTLFKENLPKAIKFSKYCKIVAILLNIILSITLIVILKRKK